MKNTLIIIVALIVVLAGVFYFVQRSATTVVVDNETDTSVVPPAETVPQEDTSKANTEVLDENVPKSVIGTTADGNEIMAYHYGVGEKEILFVGGIHGGYSWNTAMLGYEIVDYLDANPSIIPDSVKVTVIPVLNPDGLEKIVGTSERFTIADAPKTVDAGIPGRFNRNDVDLNRNFDCEWKETGTWQNKSVSGGSKPFSEPESQAIREYVTKHDIAAAVVYYSAAGGVYASNCLNGVLPETQSIMNTYAKASGYKAFEKFDYYEITGDLVNWLAKEQIPGISVLLTTHSDTEWTKNKAGIDALIRSIGE